MQTVKAGRAAEAVHECGCGPCRRGEEHASREYHRQMNLLLSRLDEQQRRWYLAVESERMGWGADRQLMEITGVDEKTIRRGRLELADRLPYRPDSHRCGDGRPQYRTARHLPSMELHNTTAESSLDFSGTPGT